MLSFFKTIIQEIVELGAVVIIATGLISVPTAVEEPDTSKELPSIEIEEHKDIVIKVLPVEKVIEPINPKQEIYEVEQVVMPEVEVIEPKTFILPNGDVVDEIGNVLIKAPESPPGVDLHQQRVVRALLLEMEQKKLTALEEEKPVISYTPPYRIERSSFSYETAETSMEWRLESLSDNSPNILKIVTRIVLEIDDSETFEKIMDKNYEETIYMKYYRTAKRGEKDTASFDHIAYNPNIIPNNVSTNFTFKIPLTAHNLNIRTTKISYGYIETIWIYTADGKIYTIENR